MADQDLDRNESATPHKLDKAREKGQVVKSQDVTTVVVLAVAVAWMYAQGWEGIRALFQFDRLLLAQTRNASPFALLQDAMVDALSMLGPFLGFLMVAAAIANIAQTGPVFTFQPLAPDATRLNPVNGLKRVFAMRSVFDLLKSLAKLAILGGIAWMALRSLLSQFHQLSGMSALGQAHLLVQDIASLGVKMLIGLAVIAAADYIFTVRQFNSRMRMSRRELKEEARNREGDPRIRGRLRELRRAMLKKAQSVQRTKDASVVITNPTHYAIALRYEHGRMAAPRLIGKGVGATAFAMRQVAARHGIPVVPSPTLARALFASLEMDHEVPTEHYAAVARIMVWVLARRSAQASMAGTPA
ncbi:MAG: EscU/YscU/HrcU family type III secretion system export apparatus switch protein [Betaproteobacteria bacterium]